MMAAIIAALGAAVVRGGRGRHRRRQHPGPGPDAGQRAARSSSPLRQLPHADRHRARAAASLILVLLGGAHRAPAAHRAASAALPDGRLSMHLLWRELRAAVPLITHGDPYLFSVIGFTLQVAAIATAVATVIGLPIGLAIGARAVPRPPRAAGPRQRQPRRCRRSLVGLVLFLLFAGQAPLGALHLSSTRRVVFVAQTILALPYTVALTAAAVRGASAGAARPRRGCSGAGRLQLAVLALREARDRRAGGGHRRARHVAVRGGGDRDRRAATSTGTTRRWPAPTLYEVNAAHYADAVAIAIVLIGLILVLMGGARAAPAAGRRHPPALPVRRREPTALDSRAGAAALPQA